MKRSGRHVEAAGYAHGKPPLKPSGKLPKPPVKPAKLRGAHAFEACADGSLIIYATMPDGDGEPHRVAAVLAACGDALARKPGTR